MTALITTIHVIVCLFLILVVLLQAGKGGGVGVAFGASTSAAVFGGRGASSFLERLTTGAAIIFMLTSMTLAHIASNSDSARLQKVTEAQKLKDALAAKTAEKEKVQRDAEDKAKELAAAAVAQSAHDGGAALTTTPAPTLKLEAPKLELQKPAAPATPPKSDDK